MFYLHIYLLAQSFVYCEFNCKVLNISLKPKKKQKKKQQQQLHFQDQEEEQESTLPQFIDVHHSNVVSSFAISL